uniref:Uncharacterized protein n=1 Tax=viral metagenome TaxID=1070528 RepID=A0A6C0HJX7_9ZZZZ
MNYCALDDAFPSMAAPSPGCAANDAAKMARKEERRRARRCKGPAASYLSLDGPSTDPDRPSEEPSMVQAMNETGLSEHAPVTAQYDGFTSHHRNTPVDQKRPNFDDDPLYNYLKSEASNHIMPIETTRAETMDNKLPPLKNFFGADPDGDSFADYIPDASDYRLQPDFQKAFGQAGTARAGSTPTVPAPPVDMYWKPLTRSGAQTSFIEHLPPSGKYHGSNQKQDDSMEEVRKKLDKLFARLDDMNVSSPEQVTSEILMFISSGIFVLFFMDLLVKKASTMRF